MKTGFQTLVVVPAFNEQDAIGAQMQKIRDAGYDLVVINDCSRDNTAQIVRNAHVPLLDLPANLGIGGAVQAGFRYAVHNGYDIVVQNDGDGQHDPVWIEHVIAPIVAGEADCVIGSRYMPGEADPEYQTAFARRMGMRFSTSILQLATGLRIHDTTSGFRALNREAVEFFAQDYPSDHPEAEALLVLHRRGFRIKEVPIRMQARLHGSSLFTAARAFFYPLRVIIGFIGIVFARKSTE